MDNCIQYINGVPVKLKSPIDLFHGHVTQRGYVAIDFYGETIMYDLTQKKP
jgi:hypothetical protein